jgi:hypothetical protein
MSSFLKYSFPKTNGRSYNLINLRFGKLVVQSKFKKGKYNYWKCVCDCGGQISPLTGTLTRGEAQSCGCKRKETLKLKWSPVGEAGFNTAKSMYIKNAKSRKLNWELTDTELHTLFESSCYYCGDMNSNFISLQDKGYSKEGQIHGQYKYNGIDRLDSKKGYFLNNVVSSCKTCNFGKQTLTLSEFALWIQKVHTHLTNKGILPKLSSLNSIREALNAKTTQTTEEV